MPSYHWRTTPWVFTCLIALATASCAAQRYTRIGKSGDTLFTPQGQQELPAKGQPSSAAATTKLQMTVSHLPLSFEANQGQTDERVDFLARGRGYTVFLTATEAVLALRQPPAAIGQEPAQGFHQPNLPDPGLRAREAGAVLRMQLVGAHPTPRVAGEEELPGKVNYFRGNDSQKWRTNIPTYARVKYQGVYPGVDLVYYGNQRHLEYDFVLAPGADPQVIRLAFAGVEGVPLRIDPNGDLILGFSAGEVRLLNPQIYQESDGVKHPIGGRYVLRPSETTGVEFNEVGFEVAAYDSSKPLIIDPVLSYSTFIGGSKEDVGNRIAVDSNHNIYLTGHTYSYLMCDSLRSYRATRPSRSSEGRPN